MQTPSIILCPQTRRVFVDGVCHELTQQEFSLLAVLAEYCGAALPRGRLLELAWGYGPAGGTRTVDIHIARLRRKLGLGQEIQTIYKYGYRLSTSRVVLFLQPGVPEPAGKEESR